MQMAKSRLPTKKLQSLEKYMRDTHSESLYRIKQYLEKREIPALGGCTE